MLEYLKERGIKSEDLRDQAIGKQADAWLTLNGGLDIPFPQTINKVPEGELGRIEELAVEALKGITAIGVKLGVVEGSSNEHPVAQNKEIDQLLLQKISRAYSELSEIPLEGFVQKFNEVLGSTLEDEVPLGILFSSDYDVKLKPIVKGLITKSLGRALYHVKTVGELRSTSRNLMLNQWQYVGPKAATFLTEGFRRVS